MHCNTPESPFTYYIITRKDCNIISDCTVSDFISDHRVLHASMYTPHPVRKQITVRALRWMKYDALAEDLDRFNVDQGCVDVDILRKLCTFWYTDHP